jgi:GNAT superfamily N-acetyltransferase
VNQPDWNDSGHSGTASCVVRLAQQGDCGEIAELAGQLGYQCTSQEVSERLSEMQDRKQYAVLVAEFPKGQIAGWIGVYLFRSVETGSWAEVNGLIVHDRVRCRGIGKALLDAAEMWARSVGCRAISVRSNIKRDRAHRFYEGNGYAHIKTQKEFHKGL